MHIGEASRRTGLTARAIRLYESAGIIRAPARGDGGYRRFDEQDVRTLIFVRNARDLGFDLDAVGRLVALWRTGPETEASIEAMLAARVAELQEGEEQLRARRLRLESGIANAEPGRAGCVLVELLREAGVEADLPARNRVRAGADVTAVRSRASADPDPRPARRRRRTARS